MEEQLPQLAAILRVVPESHHLFTTLLQSGVEVKSPLNMDMGDFLCSLPGFSADYLASNVETIFLNGTPVDDLNQPFHGDQPTLALSAAMPGLAGAIFRKNSIHSALRTTTETTDDRSEAAGDISVTLKLFNTIAKGAGATLIREGVLINSAKVVDFFSRRTELASQIKEISINNENISFEEFLQVIGQNPLLILKVDYAHG